MTKAILCDRVGCKNVLRDTDMHIVTAKWHRAEQAGIDGRLHPSSKAKRESHYCSLECAATWADDDSRASRSGNPRKPYAGSNCGPRIWTRWTTNSGRMMRIARSMFRIRARCRAVGGR